MTVRIVGVFDAQGADVFDAHGTTGAYQPVCTQDGECVVSFDCVENEDANVDFFVTLRREKNQGFFDVSVNAVTPPEGAAAVCYVLRVQDGAGEIVWVERNLCSDEYGNGNRGDISFVDACDPEYPTGTVTVWVNGARANHSDALLPWSPPCAVPADGDPAAWTGGCARTAPCLENTDTEVTFDLGGAP